MLTAYSIIRFIHIAAVALYMLIFLFGFILLMSGQHERLLLFSHRTRSVNLILLIMLALPGLYLGLSYDFQEGLWFVSKILLLLIVVFFGSYAFKHRKKAAAILTLLILIYIMAISIFKHIDFFRYTGI